MWKARHGRIALAVTVVAALLIVLIGAALRMRPVDPMVRSVPLDVAEAALAPSGSVLGGQRSGDVLGWLASQPAAPARGDAEIDVYLLDKSGQRVADATVVFDTDMTNMSHGKYVVQARSLGDGHYVGVVHFSMPGPWRVIVVAERPGKAPDRLRFDFPVSR
jgi:hypothetical protein